MTEWSVVFVLLFQGILCNFVCLASLSQVDQSITGRPRDVVYMITEAG